jgi:hypothetical protein
VNAGAYARKKEKSVADLTISPNKKQTLRRRRRKNSPSLPSKLNRKKKCMKKTGRRQLRASTLTKQRVVKKCGVILL